MNKKKILGASLGNCVHVGGVINFLQLAEQQGYDTFFLGPAVSVDELIDAIIESEPDIVAIGYRLTPETAAVLFSELKEKINRFNLKKKKFIFGGTQPTAEAARKSGLFSKVFNGSEHIDEIIKFLKGTSASGAVEEYPDNLIDRIKSKYPHPIIRHHFGLPDLEQTIEGVKVLAESRVLDVISLAPDQNAQEFFFKRDKMNRALDGAGGVPVRTKQDFERLYEATRRGNYPLMRCYSGTNDIFKMAEMLLETINNAWAAIPLCWYNVLDGRGPRKLKESIKENQELMKWHGERGIPLEVNEAHHWSLRDAHDTIAVVMAYLAAYNAKKMGVKNYIAQYMFNTPPATSPTMDLAKMLAKIELIESLEDKNFITFRQVRAGLSSFPTDLDLAKGQLAASTYLSMAIKPHILHVVAYCEAHHAATPEDIIESCKIARGIIRNILNDMPDMLSDEKIQARKKELLEEASVLLDAIKNLNPHCDDPLSDAGTLAKAIEIGLLDAPHLKGNKWAKGILQTRMINGACYAYDPQQGKILKEKERIARIKVE